jgi:hypothetical protein
MEYLHTMIRLADLDQSLDLFCNPNEARTRLSAVLLFARLF